MDRNRRRLPWLALAALLAAPACAHRTSQVSTAHMAPEPAAVPAVAAAPAAAGSPAKPAVPAARTVPAGTESPAPAPAQAATPAPAAANAAVPQYSIEQFLATVNWFGGRFSPDAKTLLTSSDRSGVINAYAVPVGGGEPVQLTDSKVSAIRALGYFPDGARILYESDSGGNEQTHLYVRNADGSTRDLTAGDKVKARFDGWSLDDRSFFFSTTERDPRYFDFYEMTADGYQRTLLLANDNSYLGATVSPDRRYLALDKSGESTEDSDVYLYDRSTRHTKLITRHQGEVSNEVANFSPDGRDLYYLTDEGSEFKRLMRYELASGVASEVLRPDWDVMGAYFSRDGRYLVVPINHDARTENRLFAMPGMRPVALPEIPDASVTGIQFSRDSKQMAFFGESSRQPRNLFVQDLGAGGGAAAPRQLTHSLSPAIDPRHLVPAEVVRFASWDGLKIPGLLYRPHGAGAGSRVPAVVLVHGGPGGQSRIGYSASTQFLVNHGYAVFAINNRGSSGYGKTFFALDDRKHGEVDLDDCVASKGMLKATGWIDPARIGIMGGSYGGYMVLAALAFRPREFQVGVDLFGVANWVRTLESIPPDWTAERKALFKEMGDPAVDHDYLVRISPLFHAEKIERPLIVLQGENDPRVLRRESDEIVEAARKRGTPVEYLIFPNEGHGFARKETQIKAFGAIVVFLDKYLKGGAPA